VQPDEEIVKIDNERGIAWIRLPPDKALGGFLGISPRILDEEKFLSFKKRRKVKRAATGKNKEGPMPEGDIKNTAKNGSSPPKP
jgi:hypothetical protein